MNKLASFFLASFLGAGLALGGARFFGNSSTPFAGQPAENYAIPAYRTANDGGIMPNNFSPAANRSMPTVVHIKAVEDNRPRNERERQFYSFFGEPAPQTSFGSGVILSKEGYIATNNHVIDGAGTLEVTLFDNRKFKAQVIGSDPSTDLAVIKIEAENLSAIEFANSDEVRVGEWALAVGNPMNLTSTVTAGIISAKGRNINLIEGQRPVESFIQTDAAVNPGNSGGALVNLDGNLIGINTAIASQTGAYSGYSFAIPANLVKKVVFDLIQYGQVNRGLLGVVISDLDADWAKEKGLALTEGVFVREVNPGGGAEEAGIVAGDVIISIEDAPIKTVPELQEKIASRNPGDLVRIKVNRNGTAKAFTVKLKKNK